MVRAYWNFAGIVGSFALGLFLIAGVAMGFFRDEQHAAAKAQFENLSQRLCAPPTLPTEPPPLEPTRAHYECLSQRLLESERSRNAPPAAR